MPKHFLELCVPFQIRKHYHWLKYLMFPSHLEFCTAYFSSLSLLMIDPILYFPSSLQPVRETREKQIQLWKELILDYCRSQKIFTIALEEDFPLFSNPVIESESCFLMLVLEYEVICGLYFISLPSKF